MNMKMMETYQKYGVNPLSQIGGCLPMVIQIPVFFGFFTMLRSAVELRGSEFLWAADLSARIPLRRSRASRLIFTTVDDRHHVSANEAATGRPEHGSHSAGDHEIHAADVRGVLYSASSGLCLYWTVQNVLSIIQTKMTKVDPDEDNKVEVIPPGKKRKAT